MHKPMTRLRRFTILLASVLLLVGGALLLPVIGHVYATLDGAALAAEAQEVNPRADYWREVREGDAGYTSASGPFTTNVLIQNGGEIWRQLRNGPVATFGAWGMAAVLALIALFHLLVGPNRLDRSLSGDRVPRWSVGERTLHWYTAILFIILAVTGLSLLFGRAVLIPLFGLEGFSAYATAAKALHNYLGPFFLAGVLVEVVVWARFNLFNRDDAEWLRHAGGMFSGKHLHAGRTNAGEKVWFWFIATIGLIGVGVSGLVLNFPVFGQERETMQIANLIHSIFGMLWVAIALGHIYIGTLGTPGALDGMTKGHVSKEWMQQHHDRWYAKLEAEGRVGAAPQTGEGQRPAGASQGQPSA
jgi:formate dehydrogenase subunit gamma